MFNTNLMPKPDSPLFDQTDIEALREVAGLVVKDGDPMLAFRLGMIAGGISRYLKDNARPAPVTSMYRSTETG